MKKTRTAICLILCVTLLAGCGSLSSNEASSASASSSQTQEVTATPEVKAEAESADEQPESNYQEEEKEPEDNSQGEPEEDTLVSTGLLSDTQDEYLDNYVSVRNADPFIAISVNAPSGYSADDVLAGMTLKNLSNPALTDPEETDLIEPDRLTVQGSGGAFTVSCAGGFNEGEDYQIILDDAALSYSGETYEVRYYNITTARSDTNNMRLAGNVSFMPASELSSNDAANALQFDGVFRFDYQSGALASNAGSGSFVYDEGAYSTGDIIAVYEGENPEDRDLDDYEEDVAYIQITEIEPAEGGRALYLYEGAEPEDVLFTPDIIPVDQECALGEGEQGSISIPADELVFTSDGEFADLGLDENTEIEAGDYLAFYTGSVADGEISAYGEITEIVWSEDEDGAGTAKISFIVSGLDEVLDSVDLYRQGTLTEAQVRSAYDEEAIKEGVIEDLTNNGYLVESSYNLAQTALETDEAKELFADADLEDLTFYYGENEEYSMTGSEYLAIADGKVANGVEIKGKPDVVVSPNIVHFAGKTGYGMGVRVEAFCKYEITIRGSELAKAGLKVTVTFFFETELAMGYTIDATSVWKWKWIFPYLYDYNISGSCSSGIYVGAGFSAVATLFENKGTGTEEGESVGIPWPEKVEKTAGTEKVMAMAEYLKEAGEKHDSIFPQQTTGGGSLSEKYAGFIKGAEKSWVDIINENIFDWNGCLDPFHIIAFRIKADFVVSAQLNAAIGVSVNYERAYRNTFNFMLIHRDSSASQTEDTDISRFRANVYIFGAMGIRAGLRLTLAIGLFDARLDSIGLEVEGGVYERFWGFFFAGIEINDVGKGAASDMYYMGAYRAEAGGYWGVTLVAQAGDGAVAYRKFIDGGEYPFWSSGTDAVVSDFAYDADDTGLDFHAEFDHDNNTAVIPSAVFMMKTMSIKDGSESSTSKSGPDTKELFDITFSDPDFSYSYENDKHILTRNNTSGGSGTVAMTITWKGNSFQTLSRDLSRTININWVANETTMKFLNKDGSIFFMVTEPAGTALTQEDLPSGEPTAVGYEFTGWADADGNILEQLPDVMPDEDTTFYSSWEGVPIPATVNYYMPYDHSEYGRVSYYLDETDVIDALLRYDEQVDDITVILEENHKLRTLPNYDHEGGQPYVHYKVNRQDSQLSVSAAGVNGDAVFNICLEWDAFTISYDDGAGNVTTRQYVEGIQIEFPQVQRQGYDFVGWADEEGNLVNAEDPPICTGDYTYTAVWEMIPPTITVNCQVKVKSWGATYYWDTVLSKELVLDSYQITIAEILGMIDLEGYEFDPNNSAWSPEDTVTAAEDGTTTVTLRFKAVQSNEAGPETDPEAPEEEPQDGGE